MADDAPTPPTPTPSAPPPASSPASTPPASTGPTDAAPAVDPAPQPQPDAQPQPQAPEPPKPGERDFVPTGEASYELRIPEAAQAWVPNAAEDKAVQAVMDGFKEAGATQGEVDAVWRAIEVLGKKGVLQPPFNPETEIQALSDGGQDGRARQNEQQTWLTALKERGELSDGAYAELMSLVPTANGVRGLEELRKAMTTNPGGIQPPAADANAGNALAEKQKQAREMAQDPRYGKDRDFRSQADKLWKEAFPG